jgi:hypothetical protein
MLTTYFLNQALQSLGSVTQAALYQSPTRASATVSCNASGLFTVTPATAFPQVTGLAVMIASPSLPTALVGLSQVYIRTVAAGQFNVYATLADALANTNMLVPASFNGTVLDSDIDNQQSVAAMLAYECSFTGYARHTASYSSGAVPLTGALTRTSPYTLTNTSATAKPVSHITAYSTVNLLGIAKLASIATVPANSTLVITTSVTAASA